MKVRRDVRERPRAGDFLNRTEGNLARPVAIISRETRLKAAMTRRSGDADLKIETKVQVRRPRNRTQTDPTPRGTIPRVVGREVLIETRVLRTRISLKFPAALATNWTRCPGFPVPCNPM